MYTESRRGDAGFMPARFVSTLVGFKIVNNYKIACEMMRKLRVFRELRYPYVGRPYTSMLYLRILDLREEYFSGFSNEEMYEFYKTLDVNTEYYSSDELITLMGEFFDE